ncbi:MAG: AI-2E family transporter [Oligoflexia bacterium]|nr:AI-2E family transporter [Oligoflexia bacterium]
MTPEEFRKRVIKRESLIRLITLGIFVVIGLLTLLGVPGMLVSFLLAFVITYMFKPVVNALERNGTNRTAAILIPFSVVGVLLWGVYKLLLPGITESLVELQAELPKYSASLGELFETHSKTVNELLSKFGNFDVTARLTEWAKTSSSNFLTELPNFISLSLTTLLLAPFFAFFMLRDGRSITKELLQLVPNNFFELSLNLIYQINQQLGGFIRARLVESLLVGAVVWPGLYLLDVPYSLFLAIVAGLTNLIPYIGPVIGAAPGLAIGFVSGATSTVLMLIALVYVVAQILDMIFIIPLVIAKIVDLHPVTVVVVIIIGSQVMGVLGMIISIPVASILKLTFSVFYNHVVDIRG